MYKTTLLIVNVIFEGHARVIIKKSPVNLAIYRTLLRRERSLKPLIFCSEYQPFRFLCFFVSRKLWHQIVKCKGSHFWWIYEIFCVIKYGITILLGVLLIWMQHSWSRRVIKGYQIEVRREQRKSSGSIIFFLVKVKF